MSNTAGNVSETDHYGKYERLPQPLRAVLARAPYNFAVSFASRELKAASDVQQARARLISKIVDFAAEKCRKTYGPDHPQATPQGWRR